MMEDNYGEQIQMQILVLLHFIWLHSLDMKVQFVY